VIDRAIRRGLGLLVLSGVVLLGGCGGEEDGSAAGRASFDSGEMAQVDKAESMVVPGVGSGPASPPPPAPPPAPRQSAPTPMQRAGAPAAADSLPPRMVIRTAFARIEVQTLDPAVAAVQRMTERLGGIVVSVGMDVGRDEVRSATLTVRVPADAFDSAMAALEPLGELESVRVQAEDVGEEYADLDARQRNARRLEARLLELLASRTADLEDVLAVERELARVREEIERAEGRMRWLRNRVALSTLTLTLHEPEPLFTRQPNQNVLARSFRQAGRNFVALVGGFIASLGVLLPLALLLGVGWWLVRRWRRNRSG